MIHDDPIWRCPARHGSLPQARWMVSWKKILYLNMDDSGFSKMGTEGIGIEFDRNSIGIQIMIH